MSRFIETIRIVNGRVMNIHYHNQRCNNTRKKYLGIEDNLQLRAYIKIPKLYRRGIIKCRIIYSKFPEEINFVPYQIKPISTLRLIYNDDIVYNEKHEDRSELQACFQQRQDNDDIIIVKKGLLTDTYYGNIALLRDGQWLTPASPLLLGTRRARLINKKRIIPCPITVEELSDYSHVCVFNAMIPFKKIILPTSEIYR